MASIPLDLQKRCEQRWAARFLRTDPTAPKKKPEPESQQQQTEPDKGKRKTHRLKPAASSLHQRCERGTEELGIFHVAADIFFYRANCCFVGLDSGNRAAGESLAAHRAGPKPFPAASVSKKTPARD